MPPRVTNLSRPPRHGPGKRLVANPNHQPDNANNMVGFRVVRLTQHPLTSEPLEGIPTGVAPAHGLAIGTGSKTHFSPRR